MSKTLRFRLHNFLLIILAFWQFATPALSASENESLFKQGPGSAALTPQQDFLPVDDAFKLTAVTEQGSLRLTWDIAPGYYLYRHRLKFEQGTSAAPLTPEIPPGKAKQDEYFGDVEVYYSNLDVTLTEATPPAQYRISYQGCADAGLCYPPQTRFVQLDAFGTTITSVENSETASAAAPPSATEEQAFTELLIDASLVTVLGLFLLAGLALTFTPCVLPMVPIISSIVVGREQQTGKGRAFTLSLVYVLAMAVTYALAGTITGYFGAGLNLQMKLQSPLVLWAIAALFLLFALAMFDFFELRLPQTIQSRLFHLNQQQQGGTYFSVAVIGVLSSLVVSPCVSAPLAGALVYISTTGDPILGGLALLALGLGMGIPLLIIGTFGANLLPKAGKWMNQVKIFFGVLLLAMAIWMVERVLPEQLILAMYLLLFLGYAYYLGGFRALTRLKLPGPAQLAGILLIGYSALLAVGASRGGYAPFAPLDNLDHAKHQASRNIMARFTAVTDLDDLNNLLIRTAADAGQPLMLDIYADWCVSCRILEKNVFPSNQVAEVLDQFKLLRADVTANSAANQELLQHFGLFGPPALLFFSPTSGELRLYRIQGEISADQLRNHLQTILATERTEELARQ